MKNVVIDGATSMLGLSLINKCISEKTNVLAIVHPSSKRKTVIPQHENITVLEAPLEDPLNELKTYAGKADYDVFFHFAWGSTTREGRTNMVQQAKNIELTIHSVEAAKMLGCQKFVGAGSQAEYGRANFPLRGDSPANPETAYGITKLCAGQMSKLQCDQLEIAYTWARIFSVYGPNDHPDTLISLLIKSLMKKRPFATTKGEQLWDYLFSEDAAEALFFIGKQGKQGKIYPVASGNPRPLREYIEDVKACIDHTGIINFGEIPYHSNQVMRLEADLTELVNDTGFVPKTDFQVGIKKTLAWLAKQ